MSDVHDFWSGRISSLPGIKPVYAGPPAPPCTPIRRNRLTGAYQPPAPVWPLARAATPLAVVPVAVEPVVETVQQEEQAPVVEPEQVRWYSIAEKFNYIEVSA